MEEDMEDGPAARLAMILLRSDLGWDQADLAREARIQRSQVSDYERGEQTIPWRNLNKTADAAEFPRYLLKPTLRTLRSFRAMRQGWSRPMRMLGDVVSSELVAFAHAAIEELLPAEPPELAEAGAPTAEDRLQMPALWERLEGRTLAQQEALVEELEEFRNWTLCEKAAAESIAAAANTPQKALELANLALKIAELAPGTETWRWHLQGYAWAHVANGRKVCNDLPSADAAIARARKLWVAGAPGDLGLLNEAWLPWIESTLHRAQRRFPEALKRIEEALDLDAGELRGKLLLSKANILKVLGDPAGSMAVLREAAPLIDETREPRIAFGVRYNLLEDLCRLGRAAEAEPGLPEVQELAERLGGELDLARTVWLGGSVSAGLGRPAEAEAAFRQVQEVFEKNKLPYDYALVSLELAVLLLEQGRTAEVSTLAEEMLKIFQAQKVHRESLAALQVFCDAAGREAATVELARRVGEYFRRAQQDPELRFE